MNDRRTHPSLWAIAMVCAASGCVGPFGPDDPSWMQATIVEGDSTTQYEGGGSYDDVRGFTINSNGLGESQGERVVFYHREHVRAPEGIYTFGPWEGDHRGFTGLYLRDGPGPSESANFVITEGLLHITESTLARIEGSFGFTAELYCSSADYPHDTPCDPSRLVQGGTPVKLEGSFSVGPPGPTCPGRLNPDGTPVC